MANCAHNCLSERGAYYEPCRLGIHVCGGCDLHNAALTEANYPATNTLLARRLFRDLKAECAAGTEEPTEFVVDLMIGGEPEDDFKMTRQMLARLTVRASSPDALDRRG